LRRNSAGPSALGIAGVRTEPGVIPVDDYLRTNVGQIFAAGDVNGRSMLVQSARMDGRIAATNAVLGPTRQATYAVVPSGSFTDPEYGLVGLTEPRPGCTTTRSLVSRAVSMAAQKICRSLGIGSFPQVWSYLGAQD
jgi:pyruvate/2-oxoglutarate dehydrogenase complex dihydrolipoamide dehydrogenase (E3) component